MNIKETKLKGVLTIEPDVFEDFRGEYVETYNEQLYTASGCPKFVQDDISVSYQNVLRGIHGDSETWKLISCLHGRFYLMVVNFDRNSEQFGEWQAFTLSDVNRLQVLVPPKFGNAHLVLSEKAIFHYKQSTYYNRNGQFTIRYDDPYFQLVWPIHPNNIILSERDRNVQDV